jgi:hypothetical protein
MDEILGMQSAALSAAGTELYEAWKGTLDLLRDGRRLLSDDRNWCQHHVLHPDGRRSVLGAVGNILSKTESPWSRAATQLLARAIGRGNDPYDSGWVQTYNDTHSHAEILALMDRTIALAEEESWVPDNPPRAWRVRTDGRWRLVAELHP